MTRPVWRGAKIFHIGRFLFIAFVACGLRALAAEQEFTIEPTPTWTSPLEVKEYDNPLEKQASAGVFCLLLDAEINGATQERFWHVAQKFLSSSGVEANSRLTFSFDPSYEKLVLHKIVIHRGTEILDRLNPDKIRVIQQERDLDRLIYNGAKTALLFLEDVRAGDWVEYSYTIRGRNPLEGRHFYDALQLRWAFPIQTENYRLLWPRSYQPLWVQIVGQAPQNRNVTDQFFEYAWHWENRPGQEVEDFTPTTTLQYAVAHFTDYGNWKSVASWAAQSFQAETPSKGLQNKIAEFQGGNMTDEQRATKALQFVQDEIRYLGIENGVNSHKPTDPSVVFARGYGDCKDKALLFCTILRSLGISSSPVLVSTRLKERVKGLTPTPWTFNHVIVQVVLDNKTHYVDVTRTFQRGPLSNRFIENFGAGLCVDENATNLTIIPLPHAGMPKTTITEDFDIPTNAPARLTIEKLFEGNDADFIREQLATMSRDSIDKGVLGYYKKYYPDMTTTRPSDIADDQELDRIRITRYYQVQNLWKQAIQTNFIACNFVSDGVIEHLFVPTKKERTQPLAIPFPENYIHRIRIETHEPWRILPVDKKIQTKGFLFHHKTSCTNNQVMMVNQILTLNVGVDAVDVPDYLAALDQIPNFLSLSISKPIPGRNRESSPNWSMWIAAISYSTLLVVVAVALYRYKPKSPPVLLPVDPQLQGLGGWLIVLGIGLAGNTLMHLVYFGKVGPLYSSASWHVITDPASISYDSMTAPLLLFELFARITLFFFIILLAVLFLQKKRFFPALFIAYLSLQFVASALDVGLAQTRRTRTVMTHAKATPTAVVAPTILPLIIWSLYLSRSKRVKLTFVN